MRRCLARLAIVGIAAWSTACAAAPPPVTAPDTLAHPEYLFPTPPPGTSAGLAARLERAWFLVQRNDGGAADREFAAIAQSERNFAPALTGQAYAALASEQHADALTRFEGVLRGAPEYVPALVGRGLALVAAGRTDDALEPFEAALALAPATPNLAPRVAALRVRQSQDRVVRAERAAAAGRWDEARAAYRAAIAASPQSGFLHRDLAVVEQRAGRLDDALTEVRRAVDLDPEDGRAQLVLGQVLSGQGEVAAALAAFERAVAIDPSPAATRALDEARANAKEAALPVEFRAIPTRTEASRADVAALLGVRLPELLARASQRQVVIADARGHWALPWIQAVVRAGAMDVFPNYTFQANAVMRRTDLAEVVSRVLTLAETAGRRTEQTGTSGPIRDVPPDHLAYPAVRRAVDAGVLELEAGAFDVLRPVSGEELVRAVGRLVALVGAGR